MEEKLIMGNTLRKFGFIFTGYLILGTFIFLKMHHERLQLNWYWIVFPLFMACFLIHPNVLSFLKKIWDFLLKLLNWINTRILLGVIFFALFTPIAVFRRIIRKNSLGLNFDKDIMTYRVITKEHNDLRRPY